MLAPALPLLLPQALWIKRNALRLPEAAQPWHGTIPAADTEAEPLRLLLLGESTVSGVGVSQQADALGGQLATQLAASTGRAVHWRALGRTGATARDCLQTLLPQVQDQRWDLAVLVLGVNDSTQLTVRRRWRWQLQQLFAGLGSCSVQVLATAVPPLGYFSALPQPLRAWFGLRSGLLDSDLRGCAARHGVTYLTLDLPFEQAYLASDGFHPSAAGYREWAAGIVRQLAGGDLSGSAAAAPSVSGAEAGT